MSEWTRAGDIDPGVALQPAIGDVWQKRGAVGAADVVWITDVLPFKVKPEDPDVSPERVCVLAMTANMEERRTWMSVADLRRQFVFRKRGKS